MKSLFVFAIVASLMLGHMEHETRRIQVAVEIQARASAEKFGSIEVARQYWWNVAAKNPKAFTE